MPSLDTAQIAGNRTWDVGETTSAHSPLPNPTPQNTMLSIDFRQIGIIAGKEFWDRIRNRWVLAVAIVFTVFALVIAYFGAAQQGAVGFRSIDLTIASLVSLVIYLIPLIALILGFDAIVGERERGSLDLLLTLPITRKELILGKYAGLAAALAFTSPALARWVCPLAPARSQRPLPLRWLHGLGHPARLCLPQSGGDALGVCQ